MRDRLERGGIHSDGVRISRVSAACERGRRRGTGPGRAGRRVRRRDDTTRTAREQPLAVRDVADRPLRRRDRRRCSQIRDDHCRMSSSETSIGDPRHLGAGHALADRVEQPLVGHPAAEGRDQIGPAIPGGVEAMTVAAAHAIERHAAADRLSVAEMRVARCGMPGRRRLREEQRAEP